MMITCVIILEPIQSRCAVLRYAKLTEAQILTRVQEVCDKENVAYDYCGLVMYEHLTAGTPL